MTYIPLLRVALHLHALLELPAAFTFYFKPSTHLPDYPVNLAVRALDDRERSWIDATEPILHSYGILQLASSLISEVAAQADMPIHLARAIGLSLAMYHVGPIRRAQARIKRDKALGKDAQQWLPLMKNPSLHLVVHAVVGGLLAVSSVLEYLTA